MFQGNVSFAGAGRVAGALSRKIFESGIKVDLIVSPTEENGRNVARSCEASWSPVPEFPESTDIILVAVPDHKLRGVLESIKCHPGTLVAHTAGSMGLDIFSEYLSVRGVFYPLQTFSVGRNVDFRDLPVLLETSDIQSSSVLQELAVSIGGKPFFVKTEQRILLHLAAVFICNFTNHMLTGGKLVAERAGVQFEIFYPLLQETVSKAKELGPEQSQTGPAVRNDLNTIEKHMELLSFSPELKEMYRAITLSIINYYNKL